MNSLVWWDAARGVIYTWNPTSPAGAAELVAWDANSGKTLSSRPCRSATGLGNGYLGVVEREYEDYESTGHTYQHRALLVDLQGKTVRKFPRVPTDIPEAITFCAEDSQYLPWLEHDDSVRKWTVHFATTSVAKAWSYELPHGIEPCRVVCTPRGQLVVSAYEGKLGGRQVSLSLRLLDPKNRRGDKILERVKPLDQPVTDLGLSIVGCGGWNRSGPSSLREVFPPLAVADWTR